MRNRIIVTFISVTMVMCVGWFFIRSHTLEQQIRNREVSDLQRQVGVLGLMIDGAMRDHRPVDEQMLRPWLGSEMAVRFQPVDSQSPALVVRGATFKGSTEPDELGNDLQATDLTSGGAVMLLENNDFFARAVYQQWGTILLLLGFVFLLVAGSAIVVGHLLSRPFRQLADAATALGRGRFQLDLPVTRIPEAREIALALDSSANQLERRIASEREFASRASHALRTPLTGLRLELDDILTSSELSDEVRQSIERSLRALDQLDAVSGELVSLSRQHSIRTGVDIPLRELATQSAQRWADELAVQGRKVTAAAEGDLTLTYSPGPVEQILELLLVDVIHRTRGPVRMAYDVGDDGLLKLRITVGEVVPGRAEPVGAPVARARTVAIALGGRLEGDWGDAGYDVWLPRR